MNDIKVDLRPHVGKQPTRIGVLEVDLGQWMVFANGFHVGYVGKKAPTRVRIIHQSLPLGAKEEIKRQVDVLLGYETPPAVNAAVILEDEDDTQEDDD
jgi:hypothetical protein